MLRSSVKNVVKKLGYIVSRYDWKYDPIAVRRSFFKTYGIDTIFDVGANVGQFAKHLRDTGYKGRIISFEPLSSAYRQLLKNSCGDKQWIVRQCALGLEDGTAEINIAGNSWSSSILDMEERHVKASPDSAYVGKEIVSLKALDTIFGEYCSPVNKVFLKIDTQGFTKQVLDGGGRSIKKITGIQVEMSLVSLYSGEPLIGEIVTTLYKLGFFLIGLQPEFIDQCTGQLLQVNGIFFRL
jgi:FkbM family methyltransferase